MRNGLFEGLLFGLWTVFLLIFPKPPSRYDLFSTFVTKKKKHDKTISHYPHL